MAETDADKFALFVLGGTAFENATENAVAESLTSSDLLAITADFEDEREDSVELSPSTSLRDSRL